MVLKKQWLVCIILAVFVALAAVVILQFRESPGSNPEANTETAPVLTDKNPAMNGTPNAPSVVTPKQKSPKEEEDLGGSAVGIPQWVPIYPKSQAVGVTMSRTSSTSGGTLYTRHPETARLVMAWYKKRLENDGYAVTVESVSGETITHLNASWPQKGKSISIQTMGGSSLSSFQAEITYNESF